MTYGWLVDVLVGAVVGVLVSNGVAVGVATDGVEVAVAAVVVGVAVAGLVGALLQRKLSGGGLAPLYDAWKPKVTLAPGATIRFHSAWVTSAWLPVCV